MKNLKRIDQLLVERGLAESREKAQALVMAGQVLADEQKIDKAGRKVADKATIRLLGEPPKFVSRAGFKIEAALEAFSVDVAGLTCLDVGSSTGGFTDCLLQRGARKVYAVDVGTNQLHWKLRQDPRVEVRERVNARYLSEQDVPELCDFVCCDVSFISAELVLPAVLSRLKSDAQAVLLAKPQFEVGRGQVGKGGIVTDSRLHAATVEKLQASLGSLGFGRVESMDSPILGAEGNKEFLLWASERGAREGRKSE